MPPTVPVDAETQLQRLHERYLDLVRQLKRAEKSRQRERDKDRLSDIGVPRVSTRMCV